MLWLTLFPGRGEVDGGAVKSGSWWWTVGVTVGSSRGRLARLRGDVEVARFFN